MFALLSLLLMYMYVQVFTCKTSAVGAMILCIIIDGMLRINVHVN